MNRKGFLLVDSLICIFILLAFSSLVLSIYTIIDKNTDSYERYNQRMNDRLDNIYMHDVSCEGCILDDVD